MSHQMAFDLPEFFEQEEAARTNPADSIRKITWSYSRRGTLIQCPRRYYYTYYASNKRAGNDDNRVRFLSLLQNRYERTGQLLHLVISTFLRKLRDGESWSTSRLCSWAMSMFSKDCEQSKMVNRGNDNQASGNNKSTFLQEFYYDEPDAEIVCANAKDRLLKAIREFAENNVFAELIEKGKSPEALIEFPIKIDTFPCRVTGRIDLAFQQGEEVTVVDWKLGGTQGGEDSLQLATYGTWATTHFSVDPGTVHIHKALLENGELTTSLIDEQMIQRARARIIQDAEHMAALDDYGRAGTVDAFTPCSQKAICRLCRFREICQDGRECCDA